MCILREHMVKLCEALYESAGTNHQESDTAQVEIISNKMTLSLLCELYFVPCDRAIPSSVHRTSVHVMIPLCQSKIRCLYTVQNQITAISSTMAPCPLHVSAETNLLAVLCTISVYIQTLSLLLLSYILELTSSVFRVQRRLPGQLQTAASLPVSTV